MNTYTAFQAFFKNNEIPEEYSREWKEGTAELHRLRHQALKRLTK